MAEVARGSVTDRPWGKTLARIGLGGHTGQLSVNADGKRFDIAFMQGAVVSAASPLAADAAVRVAITGHLISSSQIGDVARRQAAQPGRDEVDVIADLARLGPEHTRRLRRRVIAHRAARTFSINRGDFVLADKVALKITPGCELDIRAIIYMGARANLSEQRLSDDLEALGGWFRIKSTAHEDLAQFGFGEAEQPVLARLHDGASVTELESLVHGTVDPRTVQAIVYTLAVCGACDVDALGARPVPGTRPPKRASTEPPRDPDSERRRTRDPDSERRPRPSSGSAIGTGETDSLRQREHDSERRHADPRRRPSTPVPADLDSETRRDLIIARRKLPASRPPASRGRATGDTIQAHDVVALIAQRLKLLDQGADHFKLLGVSPDAKPADVRKAYFALARQLHPDKLSALGIPDEGRHAQRLFAQVNTAFAVLSDPKRHRDYLDIVRRGGEAAVRAEQQKAEDLAARILEAEEAYRRGELALRRDNVDGALVELTRAVELNPDEPDYHSALAWAQFCAAPDKPRVAKPTRDILVRHLQRAPKSITPRFYLGRLERMLGRDAEALKHFREVLDAKPNHADAQAEVRAIEARLQGPPDKGGGLFGRRRN